VLFRVGATVATQKGGGLGIDDQMGHLDNYVQYI